MFFSSALCVRLSVPLGLNMCPPFHSIAKSERPASILPPARTVVEDETRRNTFWLAYAVERQHSMGNGWALGIDDQDISQLLPVRGDQFENGVSTFHSLLCIQLSIPGQVLVTPLERQWAHTNNILLTHPRDQIDSFILYVKGTLLICKLAGLSWLALLINHFSPCEVLQ